MAKLLEFNPDKRIPVEDCLAHAYVEQFHTDNEDDETVCEKAIGTTLQPRSSDHFVVIPIDDNKKLNVAAYRNELYQNVIKVEQEKTKIKRKERRKRRPSILKSDKKKKEERKKSSSKEKVTKKREEKKKKSSSTKKK